VTEQHGAKPWSECSKRVYAVRRNDFGFVGV
jgi:hypothetical protein